MEVHHPHHAVHSKKTKEYFLEFFMLFLAVSLGFLAENIREHYVEKERAHELLQSFMNDVKTNVHLIDSLVDNNQKLIVKNDSAVLYLYTSDHVSLDSFYSLLPLISYRYLNNNETYDQMKSSGSLRYIKDTILLKNIIEYSNLSKSAEYRSVDQEAAYVGTEYTSIMQKWIPEDISIKRQAGIYLTRPEYMAMFNKNNSIDLINRLNDLAMQHKGVASGDYLKQMRKELINPITRKLQLISGSNVFMLRTKKQALKLLDYYNEHKE